MSDISLLLVSHVAVRHIPSLDVSHTYSLPILAPLHVMLFPTSDPLHISW